MSGHHLCCETCVRLHLRKLVLGLLQSGIARGERAVGRCELFRAGQDLFAECFRTGSQQRFLLLCLRDVCVDCHPTTFGQRCAFNADHAAIGAGAFHIMRLEREGELSAYGDELLEVVNLTVFTSLSEKADNCFKTHTSFDQLVRQIEHLLHWSIDQHQTQI